jgi:hypothetical protein
MRIASMPRVEHDLEERHQVDRVEEVGPDDTARVAHRLGDAGDAQRRRVRRQDRARLGDGVDAPEEVVLQREVLGDRLDEEETVPHRFLEVRRAAQPGERGLAILGRGLPLLDALVEVLADLGEARRNALSIDVVEVHIEPGDGADVGDAVAHRARPEHGDAVERHARASTMVATPCPTPTHSVARP